MFIVRLRGGARRAPPGTEAQNTNNYNLCMYVYMCIYIHTPIYIHIYTHICVYIYIYTHML